MALSSSMPDTTQATTNKPRPGNRNAPREPSIPTSGPVPQTGPLSADERLTARSPQAHLPLVADDYALPTPGRGRPSENSNSVPDQNPFVARELRRLRNAYTSRLGVFLYVFGLALYLERTAVGDLPPIPDWVTWTTVGGCVLTALILAVAIQSKPRPWVSGLFTLVSAAILTLAVMYHGHEGEPGGDTFGSLYLLTLVVPMLFYSRLWAVLSVAWVSALSML